MDPSRGDSCNSVSRFFILFGVSSDGLVHCNSVWREREKEKENSPLPFVFFIPLERIPSLLDTLFVNLQYSLTGCSLTFGPDYPFDFASGVYWQQTCSSTVVVQLAIATRSPNQPHSWRQYLIFPSRLILGQSRKRPLSSFVSSLCPVEMKSQVPVILLVEEDAPG